MVSIDDYKQPAICITVTTVFVSILTDHNLIQNYCIKTFGCIPEEPNFGGVVCQWRMISTSSEVDFTAKVQYIVLLWPFNNLL